MQGFNHIAGGMVFTGLFASFHDVNVFEKPEYIITTIAISLLPDIDHTRSLLGKAAFPLAKWLMTRFGHRTITHSLLFLIACLIITKLIEFFYLKNTTTYSIIVGYALLSHLIFDMVTRTGIPFFWPFSTRPCVLPDNPSMRLRTNDLRSEAVVFIVFNGLLLFCWPLFEKGFWTNFNQAFMTLDHIEREAKRKGKLLSITFIDNQKDTLNGTLIHSTQAEFIIHANNNFQRYKEKDCRFLNFTSTNKAYKTQKIELVKVSEDSLKTYLVRPLISLQIQAANDFNYFEGAVLKTTRSLTKDYVQGFNFYTEEQDNTTTEDEIKTTQARIGAEQRAYYREVNQLKTELANLEQELREGNQKIYQLSDYQKGVWIQKRPKLEQEIGQLKQQIQSKTPPDTQTDWLHIQHLRNKLKSEKQLFNANLEMWVE